MQLHSDIKVTLLSRGDVFIMQTEYENCNLHILCCKWDTRWDEIRYYKTFIQRKCLMVQQSDCVLSLLKVWWSDICL